MINKILGLILVFCLLTPTIGIANDTELTILDENDYKKMPKAWHWTALYPPAYAVVGICNGVRIHKAKKKIRQHNNEVLRKLVNQNTNITANAEKTEIKTHPINTSIVEQKTKEVIDKTKVNDNLICIKLEHSVEFVFRLYTSDIQQKTETSIFYVDAKNKQIYREDKTEVDYIKEFSDSKISFMVIDYTKKFKICRCYDIDRYTGSVTFTLFQHPLTMGAKFDQGMLDIKDGYVGRGEGTASKLDITKQKF